MQTSKTRKLNFKKLVRRENPPVESKLVLFGNAQDPELQETINRAGLTKRKIEMVTRPSFDTGLGRCGRHLCSCKTHCMASYNGKAYEG